jgi:hypothetical protein
MDSVPGGGTITRLAFLGWALVAVGCGAARSEGPWPAPATHSERSTPAPVTHGGARIPDTCSPHPKVVEIREADPAANRELHDRMRSLFVASVVGPDTTILLGPDVVLDFSTAPDSETRLRIGRCVTIKSVASFDRQPNRQARSSVSPGPVLKFGPHRSGRRAFLVVACKAGDPLPRDHVRISGFRLFGPRFGQQSVGDVGIRIAGCVDVEISNMEIAGWGGAGIKVEDGAKEDFIAQDLAEPGQLRKRRGACREPPSRGPRGRIGNPSQVRIVNNFIHHNQHPRTTLDGRALGYGVVVGPGAWAQIDRNLFSHNRHAIAANGTMGGYQATNNLVLRYGGVHYREIFTVHTHAFDIHGTGVNGFGGFAGSWTLFAYNAFQYRAGAAISVRGSPRCGIEISHNIFAHPGLEDDRGDDAVKLHDRKDLEVVRLGPANAMGIDTYGQYGVCDFNGDNVDDLFLPTGVSWWFSGGGEFPWRFLARRSQRLDQVRLGYFDADDKCDVLAERGGRWVIASGGTGDWQPIGDRFAPLAEVQFGRFAASDRDHRRRASLRATHAFWRTPTGQWRIAPLSGPDQGWKDISRSSVPMSELRFGDFDGDGATDVLSVQGGRWAISSAGAGRWRNLNPRLGDDVRGLYIADIDESGIDDLLRVQYEAPAASTSFRETYEWQVSYDGRTAWKPLKKYSWSTRGRIAQPAPMFAGRFGKGPGDAVLTIDRKGIGRFHGPAATRAGGGADWVSRFAY